MIWLNRRINRWDDLAERREWPDWAFAPEWGVLEKACSLLGTHEAEDDQCMRPEHRYCWHCQKAMPYARLAGRP